MKPKLIGYWVSTVLFAGMMAMSGAMYFSHSPEVTKGFAHLGYPPYFANLLGVAKILGAVALLAPRFPILKEWAYSGFTITLVSAVVSHAASGDGAKEVVGPLIGLGIMAASYALRPEGRRVAAKA
jgi:uncharacterized membrane protein YphA (DoxX/SURF4 family)